MTKNPRYVISINNVLAKEKMKNDLKRLALEVIAATVAVAQSPVRSKEKEEAIAFLTWQNKGQRCSRDAWLEAAGIPPTYFEKKVISKLSFTQGAET